MNLYTRLAFGCHLVAALLLSLFGFVYLFRPEFMPYHAVALSRDWDAVERPVQILILALMRVVGGAWLATALAVMILLLIPFRQGAPWARWAIPAAGLVAAVPSLYATL
ncbi:MAG: hypothetical protein HC922_04710 [Leptolyngbyaceae cyanobacterium SM2_3_12]|nr:hypothetical protein [Leptolyngbyaceae cyanobacterium SM2_3_12]